MTTYNIEAGLIETTVEAATVEAAIAAYVREAGYASIEEAAKVCNQTVEQFLADIIVTEA